MEAPGSGLSGRSSLWWDRAPDLGPAPGLSTASQSRPTDADLLTDVEAVVGTAWAHTIIGSAADERLEGGGGSDLLSGQGGNDTLVGGSDLGLDTFEIVASPGHEVVIKGFQVMHDVLLFRGAEFDVTAAWGASNGDAVITFEGGTVRVVGVEPHPELAGSVVFAPHRGRPAAKPLQPAHRTDHLGRRTRQRSLR